MEAIQNEIEQFRKRQVLLNKFGALDGEVTYQMESELKTMLNAPKGTVFNPIKWELYTCSMNCTHANTALNMALRAIHHAVDKCTDAEKEDIKVYFFGVSSSC